MTAATNIGRSYPLGATVVDGGVNFSLFSRTASGVEILFFDREDDSQPSHVVSLDAADNRTYHYWHAFVPRIRSGQLYGYRVKGQSAPERGLRFDSAKVLLDPYGRGVALPRNYGREAARRQGDNTATAMKSVVVDPGTYDWEGDTPLCRPSSRTIIYEMHVRGFTRHPSSGVGEKTRGNNNAYCQDNEISWFDWTRVDKHVDVHRFLRLLIERRALRDVEHERQRMSLTNFAGKGCAFTSFSMPTGSRSPLSCPDRRAGDRGGAGSIPGSNHRTTSSRGRRRCQSRVTRIAPKDDR